MAWNKGWWFPWGDIPVNTSLDSNVVDATGEYLACVGRIAIDGQATSKTIDTTGSSSITFSVNSGPVFDNAGSVFTIGFQGIDSTTGFPVRPNGTWGARSVVTTVTNTNPVLTNTSDYHVAIPTLGTSTFSHGDDICIVMEMTTRAGSDSLNINMVSPSNISGAGYPTVVTNVSGSVASQGTSAIFPVLITFSDGTIGTLDGGRFIATAGGNSTLIWTDASNPDEYGMIFQVPWDCTIDAVGFPMRLVDGTSDFSFDLTSTPEGTPASLISGPITKDAQTLALGATEASLCYTIPAVNLTANTDYCLSVKATGAGNLRFARFVLPTAGSRALGAANGTTVRGVDRNGGSGAYAHSNTTIIPPMAVRISNITTGGGAGQAGMLFRAQGVMG